MQMIEPKLTTCYDPTLTADHLFARQHEDVIPDPYQTSSILDLFDTSQWLSSWECGIWTEEHGWLYILSDISICIAYFTIPGVIGYFYYRRKSDLPFKSIFLLFIAFIVVCGLTHLVDAAIFWWPAYKLSAWLRFTTALISWGTVLGLVHVLPDAMRLQSPEQLHKVVGEKTKDLSELNDKLSREIEKRIQAEEELKAVIESQEQMLNERTAELRRLNQLFESTQSVIGVGTWELDLVTKEIYWSDKVYDIHEVERGSQLQLDEGLDFYHADYKNTLEKAIADAVNLKKGYDLELILITATGKEIWVKTVGIPVEEEGKVTKLRGLFQDIDQRKRLELEQEATQRTLELFVNHAPAAIAMFDRDMRYLLASKKWYEDYSLENRQIVGQHHYDIFPEIREMPAWIEDHKRALAGEVIRKDNDPFERKDGSKQWLKYEIYPWYNLEGEIGGIGMFTEDVTEERELSNKIRQNEQRFRSVMRHSAIGMALVSTEGVFLDANEALTDILGYTNEELLQLSFQEITHPDDLEKDVANITAMLNHEIQTYEIIKRYFNRSGEMVWAQLNVSAAYTADTNERQVQFFISQIQDVTQKIKIEEERKNAKELLEAQIKKRTIELKAANKELEAFSYSVSHDLRSPLRSINGFSQALLEDYQHSMDETAQEYLDRICKAANRMGALIDDLLALSRISRRELVIEDLNISAMAADTLNLMDINKQPEIKIMPDMHMQGDRSLIAIALDNLIGNAIKYSSKEAHPKVEILSNTIEGEKMIIVRDNGVGFDMQHAKKLFGAFQRLHHKSDFEGTGIGLATVQRIINLHGGRIWAESKSGEGSTFYFTTQ
ncbi:MAG: PAS domain S-box protein [Bacteroidota bacterium]